MGHDVHGPGACACCSNSAPGQQSLDELAFLKSACAAAQQGNVSKLERILRDHPTAVSDDGVGGALPCRRVALPCWRVALPFFASASHAPALNILTPTCTIAGQSGYTPLLYAGRAGHVAAVQTLLMHGTDIPRGRLCCVALQHSSCNPRRLPYRRCQGEQPDQIRWSVRSASCCLRWQRVHSAAAVRSRPRHVV